MTGGAVVAPASWRHRAAATVRLVRDWGPRLLVLLALVAPISAPPARAEAADDLVYVALGDSYTSGPLVLPHDTTWVPQDCGQSLRNYPHLAAARMHATRFEDVSCGSATIDDLYEPQTGLPLGGTNAAQLDALGPDVDVVTLGMGGNDVGFTGLALDCVRFLGPPTEQPCTPDYQTSEGDKVSERIARVGPELGQALDDIHVAAPNAEVFVVSYPTALPDDAVACWPYLPILQDDMPYLVAKFKEMNAMLAEQASLHGATYVDIYTPSIGHDACQPPGFAWVNGMVVAPPSYPAHPNELGLARSGKLVAAAVMEHLAP
jgi:lysophospholipase L1-like esterase